MQENIESNRKELRSIRRKLRNAPTPAESALWKHLRANRLDGTHWRRQFSIANYILDFYCPSIKLCIELDGHEHYTMQGDTADYDRTCFLNSKGIKVIRFENREIWENPELVLERIRNEIKSRQYTDSSVFKASLNPPPL